MSAPSYAARIASPLARASGNSRSEIKEEAKPGDIRVAGCPVRPAAAKEPKP